ncbi:FAS-associated death domain protein isoform X2 [Egretta garzetta]|uniref:FAS-associated death domain protein isoform X2 n=1 Tax=Egretta garzetta TaxID=188379 RepID=UPI00163CAB6B|nr:FAS-associated death domain protein isoform X2 [Egretta garzetta]
MDSFYPLLHFLSSSLSEGELSSMKFLCRPHIGKRKLESVQSGMDLFSILLEQQQITRNDLSFLEDLLKNIKREDLVLRLKQFEEEREVSAPDDQPDVHEKRLQKAAIEVICENVGREWKMLMRKLGISEAKMDGIMTANPYNLREQVFQSLREWQKGRDAKCPSLRTRLLCCVKLHRDKIGPLSSEM